LAAVASVACQPTPKAPRAKAVVQIYPAGAAKDRQPIAEISETTYRQELARARLTREGSLQAAALSPALKRRVLVDMIDSSLLLRDAAQHGVEVSTAAVANELARMESALSSRELRRRLVDTYQRTGDLSTTIARRLLIGALMTKQAHAGVEVDDAEIHSAWNELAAKDKLVPKLVRASQIVVRTEEEGREIVKLLRGRTTFEELARTRSLGPESANGGDLGWFEAGVMPKVFDDVCFSLRPGQTSKLTPSEYGFHVFRVHQVEPERELTLEEMKGRLRSKILHKKLQAAEQAYLQSLRRRYDVKTNDPLLASIE